MILYHGSNVEIEEIDLTRCMPYKDFGRGFYTTSLEEQARRMQYTFHTEKALKYLKKVGVADDK